MLLDRVATRFLRALLLLTSLHAAELQPTAAPAGPYYVAGNQILDRQGAPYVIRGTELAAVTLGAIKPGDLGALSASALVTIRQRLNMNAVWLPFQPQEYERTAAYRARVDDIVRSANRLALLVILAPQPVGAPSSFWTALATAFRGNPDVFFAVDDCSAVTAIRAAGAAQPVLAPAGQFPLPDPNVIYVADAGYIASAEDRQMRWEALSKRAPTLVKGLDPHIDEDSAECTAFPADPAAATTLIQSHLDFFDAHQISWVISSFTPLHLISDTRTFTGAKLDDGWTCGQHTGMAGLGMILLAHLWRGDPHGLFAVNGEAGSFYLPRGGRAVIYGPILADHEAGARPGQPPPTRLDNVSVRVTDSRGVARLAALLYTGGGWSFLTFVVPGDAAPGLTEIAVVRTDGSHVSATAIIADIAPGLLSASVDGRGPVKGVVTQRMADGSVRTSEAARCPDYPCRTVPIPLARGVSSVLRLDGTGFRHAHSISDIQAMVGGIAVPVISFGVIPGNPGSDQLTIRLPDELIGAGETDLWLNVSGHVSNILRIDCGGKR